jgi:outer membrane protein assembly factor BamB
MHLRQSGSRLLAIGAFMITIVGCRDNQLPLQPNRAELVPPPTNARATVLPIPQQVGAEAVPAFIGEPATPSPVFAAAVPQNRFLAPNGSSNIHNDSYMSDVYETAGPLGNSPRVLSAMLGTSDDWLALPVSMAFDRYGRILLIPVGQKGARLLLLEAKTLEILATLALPTRSGSGGVIAGSYFVLDRLDRVVLPTATGQIWVVDVIGGWNRPRFAVNRVYDLTSAIDAGDQIGSVLPDFAGTLWAVTKAGTVVTINPSNGRVESLRLPGERIENSLAADETGGVFIVSDHALYRFDAGGRNEPVITWREGYDRGTRQKPGQFSQGSGTTPTLMGRDLVAITDNADPYMQVLVYYRAAQVTGQRLVSAVPVFGANAGATENSLVGTDHSIIVENNYGYSGPEATSGGRATTAGLARIDLDANGHGHVVWTSTERVPSLVTKASLANGLIYTYTKDPGPGTTDAWYFTAIDFSTGRTVWKRLAGTGLLYNNHYSGLHLGRDGAIYVGVGGGVVSLRDAVASP